MPITPVLTDDQLSALFKACEGKNLKDRLPSVEISTLVDSFDIALQSAHRSGATRTVYLSSVRRYPQWCTDHRHPAQIDTGQVSAWIAHILASDAKPATATARLAGVRRRGASVEPGRSLKFDVVGTRQSG
jgi:hypothetical protein